MSERTVTRMLGKAGGALAAIAVAAIFSAAPAVSQEESDSAVAAVPPSPSLPDPAIAQGLDIFDEKGEKIGTIEEVGTRNGQQVAVLAIQEWSYEPAQRVVVPFRNLRVSDGLLTYDVANASGGDPLKRDPKDNVDWESQNEIHDADDE